MLWRVVLSSAHTHEEEAAGSPSAARSPWDERVPEACPRVWFPAHPQGAPGQGGSRNMFCVTFNINFLVKSGLFLAVILYKEHL